MMFLMFLFQISAESANPPCVVFKGGPAEGMCPGAVISRRGTLELVELLPALGAGAATPPPVASTLSKLLRSHRKGKPIERQVLASGATAEFCPTFAKASDCLASKPLRSWPLTEEFVSNPPYLLADGRIRIEWMRNGKLEYLSLITFDAGKVKDVATVPAQVPRVLPQTTTSAPATAESTGRISPDIDSAIVEWNNCRTESAYDHAEMPQSADVIVDEAFEACSTDDRITKTAWLERFGPGSGGQFEARRIDFRDHLVAKIESFKTGKPLANDLRGTWGICVRKHVPKPLPADASTEEIANSAFAACSPELEMVRTDFAQKSGEATGAYVVEQLQAVQRPAIIRQIERARKKR